MTASGCRCRACCEGKPHQPVDEGLILRALHHAGFDILAGTSAHRHAALLVAPDHSAPPKRGAEFCSQPWMPRPARPRLAA